ncbi:hypothetical protein N566_05665 [Streptomycetaceae bacterium MP113-05]|nr:hypothetical protein N566_05665 [Streptomycetaceae bacterium MP113-05]
MRQSYDGWPHTRGSSVPGVHLLVGPSAAREPDFTARLLAALTAFVLADAARRRIVVEPDALNGTALARLTRAGFTLGPEVALPAVEGPRPNTPASPSSLSPPGCVGGGGAQALLSAE